MTLPGWLQQIVTVLQRYDRDKDEFVIEVHGFQRGGKRQFRLVCKESQVLEKTDPLAVLD